MIHVLAIGQIAAVIACVVIAAALATPRGRLPLALRALAKMTRRQNGLPPQQEAKVSAGRRFCAFLFILFAVVLALIRF